MPVARARIVFLLRNSAASLDLPHEKQPAVDTFSAAAHPLSS
jgi:hypothetical protein